MHHLHSIDYTIIILYLLFTIVAGLVLTRIASKSLDHYFLGNRSLPWWMLGITGMSDWFDMTGTMIITSFLFMLGPRGLFIEFRGGAVLILPFLLAYLGKWHRRSGCMTGIEWMVYRYGRTRSVEAVRVVSALVSIIGTIAVLAYLVRGASLFMGIVFPFPPMVMTLIVIAITALYTMCSGFYGVVVTDLVQGVIIIVACVAIAAMAWMSVPDVGQLAHAAAEATGNGQWVYSLPSVKTPMPRGYERYEALLLFAGFYLLRNMIGGMGGGAEPRYFGARSDRDCGLQSMLQGITIMFRWPLMIGFAILGVYMVRELFPDQSVIAQTVALIQSHYPDVSAGTWHELTGRIVSAPQNFSPLLIQHLEGLLGPQWATKLPLAGFRGSIDPEQILPAVLLNKVPAGLAGFIIVAMFAALMNSLSNIVNRTSAFFVKDVYQVTVRPQASNRELIAVSWISTLGLMIGGIYMGLAASSINDLWGWIVMSLSAGGLAPTVLRLYWWRTSCWGVICGMVLGTAGAIVQRFAAPSMVEWQQFLLMTAIFFAGTIGGSLLTAPASIETLRHFYRTTRPFGLWGPLKQGLSPAERAVQSREHVNDILTVPFGLLSQVTMFLLPMQFVIKSYGAFWRTLPFFLVGVGGMYWFWWRNLPGIRS